MTNETDYVADIMNKWYEAMQQNKIMVQPKASTILGIILARYKIEPLEEDDRDVWAEALTKRGGEFMAWYKDLSESQQAIYHARLEEAPTNSDLVSAMSNKALLKG